mmetsp:Transcript_55179/g.173019  ORF Transcript_55179/g.173019 Transcript_55179/m.173019 type:complete len:412 (-) Transcript_55179:69-1304(-)
MPEEPPVGHARARVPTRSSSSPKTSLPEKCGYAASSSSSSCFRCFPSLPRTRSSSSRALPQQLDQQQARAYFEYPIGDPRRRPRWGVPMRFDIRQMAVVKVELWIFDLLTMDHRWRLVEPGDTKMAVSSLFISRESLEAGDERRAGGGPMGDSIHGVYLGELIWVLIAQLLPKVLEHSTSNFLKTAFFATGFAARDSAVTACAKVLDFIFDAKRGMAHRCYPCMGVGDVTLTPTQNTDGCYVHVHLIRGRGIAHDGQRVNVHARLELRDPPSNGERGEAGLLHKQWTAVDVQDSALRLWTKTPWWDQHFLLGPAGSTRSVLRILLFFRKTRHAANTNKCEGKIGEVVIQLQTLLVRDKVIDGQMVGWFPLEAGQSTSGFRGRLKLGLKLSGRQDIPDLERASGWRSENAHV